MGIAYRLRQLRANLSAGPLSVAARQTVAETLSQAETTLFYRLILADQWHSYRVLCDLHGAGYNDPDLSAAALLHDIGKTRAPLSAWDRTVVVVGGVLFPRRAVAWGDGALDSWRRPFVVRARHAEWGAEMAVAAGSRLGVVDLIRRHQDKAIRADDERLRALQWADDRN